MTATFILKKFQHIYIVLNHFPYNPGHLMVVPYRHCAQLYELTDEEHYETMKAVSKSSHILQNALGATGVNVGINLGDKASGGSIPDHLHVHIVPRWKGDTSFMPIVANTKPLSRDLQEVFQELEVHFSKFSL